MKFINLCTVDNSYEADFITDDLEEHGIEYMVTNENFTSLMPHMSGIPGCGIQILVDANDYESARQILEKRSKKEITVCPTCGSHNIKYGLGTKKPGTKLSALFLSLFTGVPIGNIKQTYYCIDCKSDVS